MCSLVATVGWAFLLLINSFVSTKLIDDYPQVSACKEGNVVQNSCMKCICSSNGIYDCSANECSRHSEGERGTSAVANCLPYTTYHTNWKNMSLLCICKRNGQWPNKKCNDTFKTLKDVNEEEQTCKPNSYIFIDCNVCHCSDKGFLDKTLCTKNVCKSNIRNLSKNVTETRRSHDTGPIENCKAMTWYSMGPCQVCFCINDNRLVCNTGTAYSKNLVLGRYNFTECGTNYIKETLALLPSDVRNVLRNGDLRKEVVVNTPKTKIHFKHPFSPEPINYYEKNIQNEEINKKDHISLANYKENAGSESEEMKLQSKANSEWMSTVYPPNEDISSKESNQIVAAKGNENSEENNESNSEETLEVVEELKDTLQPSTLKELRPKKNLRQNKYKSQNQVNLNEIMIENMPIDFPSVLSKVFNMALRKSMVTLDSKSACEPGSTLAMKCNTCFCMKNGKLLCTNKTCR